MVVKQGKENGRPDRACGISGKIRVRTFSRIGFR